MEPATQPPKLRKIYDYLKKKGKVGSPSYEEFEGKMRNEPGKLERIYNHLRDENRVKSENFEDFHVAMFPDLKKKEQTQADSSAPTSAILEEVPRETSENQVVQQQPEAPPISEESQPGLKNIGGLDDQQKFLLSTMRPVPGMDKPVTEQDRKDAEYFIKKPRSIMGALNSYGSAFNKPVLESPGNLLKTVGVGGSAIDRAVGISDKSAEETTTYQLGQKWNDFVKPFVGQVEPQYQDDFLTKLFSGLGSIATLLVARGNPASTGAKLTQGVAQSIPKIVAQQAGVAVQQAAKTLASRTGVVAGTFAVDEYEQAKKQGSTEDEAFNVFLKNYFVNQTDAIPLEAAFSKLNTLFKGSISKKLSAIGQGGIIEGTQEGIQQYLTNQIAKGSYDPDRDTLFGVLDNIKVGGVLGMLLPAIGSAAQRAPAGVKEKLLAKAQALENKAISLEQDKILQNENPQSTTPQSPAVQKTEVQAPEAAEQTETAEEVVASQPAEEPQANELIDNTVQDVSDTDVGDITEQPVNEPVKTGDYNARLKEIEGVNSAIEKMRTENPKQFNKSGRPVANSKLKGQYNALVAARDAQAQNIQSSMEEEFSLRAENENEISRQDTQQINEQFEARQKELMKYLPEEHRVEEELFDKINTTLDKAKERPLSEDDVSFLNDNAFRPVGFDYDNTGSLIRTEAKVETPTAVQNEIAQPQENDIQPAPVQPENIQPVDEEVPAPVESPKKEASYSEGQEVEFEWLGDTQKGKVVGPADESGKILVQNARGTKYRVRPSVIENAPKRKAARTESVKDLKNKLDQIVKNTEPQKVKDNSGKANIKINPFFYLDQTQKILLDKIVRKAEDYISKAVNNGLKNQNYIVRNASGLLQNILGGAAYKTSDLKGKLEFTGNKNYANLYAKGLSDDLYKLIDSDADALERVHEALDPEIAKDPKNPVDYSQLNAKEKALYDLLRTTNDFIHNWHYSHGLISDETYQKYKGKYIARLYEKFELMPPDVRQEIKRNKADFNMFKTRKDYEDVDQEILRDPVYATAKRVAQMMQNQAIFEYAESIDNSSQIKVSDMPFPNSTQLGQPGQKPYYGVLTGKYVPNYIAQDFKGFFFANDMMDKAYSAFRGYDKNIARQMLKRSHTVWNPVVQLGNLLSNFSFAYWAGIDPFTFAKNKVKAIKEVKKQGQHYSELVENGIIDTDVLSRDLQSVLQKGNPNALLGASQNRLRQALANTKVGKFFEKFDEIATNVYKKTDDTSKMAAYLSLRNDYGYSKEEALQRVFESFQNYSTVGKMYDFAAKTPFIGNPYIKFKADLMRIIKNGLTRRPLTTMTYVAGLRLISSMLSDASDEDEDVRKARERRSFIPKIKTPAGDIPMTWQVPGVGEVNFARFLSPYYVYDKGDRNDMVNEITDWLPYQVEMASGLSPSSDNKIPIPEFGDVLLGTYAQVAFDRDFRGKSVRDPKGNDFLTQATGSEQIVNSMNYIGRSQIPMFKSTQDMMDAINGDLDYFGRERSVSQAILNNIIKVQEFGSKQAKDQLEKEIRYKVAKFYSYSRDIGELKSALKKELIGIENRTLAPEKKQQVIQEEAKKFEARVAERLEKQREILKEIEEPAKLLKSIETKFPD